MNKEDICFMPAYEMAEKIKTQELTSLEITETIIERIEKINPILNAYCTTAFDLAREMAKKADEIAKKGEKLGLLNGIPTSIKDLMDTKGILTTHGSKLYENFIPEQNDIPSYPRIGIHFITMDHYGPIVRFVKDAALMLNIMKGHHPADNNSFPDDDIDYIEILNEKPKKLKIGYSTTLGFGKILDDEVKNNILDRVQMYQSETM